MQNILKYIFLVFLVILLSVTGYFVYKFNNQNIEKQKNIKKEETINILQRDLRLGVAELDTMNPILTTNRNVYEISKLFYDSLITLEKNYELKFQLAENIIKEDDKHYRVILKKDMYWQGENGKITAEDVEFTINQINKSKGAYKENVSMIESTKIIDENTIMLNLKEAQPFFEYNLTFPIMKKVEEKLFTDKEKYNFTKCSGKYLFKELKNTVAIFEKNEKYHDKEFNPSILKIFVTLYGSSGELYNGFKSGNIDLITTKEINFNKYIGTEGFVHKQLRGREFEMLAFNNEVFQNAEIKQGIYAAINKNKIIEKIPGYQVATYPLDYGSQFYFNLIEFNESKQRRTVPLLYNNTQIAESKLKSISGKRYNLLINSENNVQKQIALEVKEQLKQFKIHINIEETSANNYYARINKKKYDMAIIGIRTSYSPNIERFFGNINLFQYKSKEMLNNLKKASNEKITSDRTKILEDIYKQIELIYIRDVPFIGIARDTTQIILSTGLTVPENNSAFNNYNLFYDIAKWYRK